VFQTLQRGAESPELELAADYPFEERALFDHPTAPRAVFLEGSYAGDPTNWWIPNPACSMAMLRSAGFELLQRPEPEVYVCRRRELSPYEQQLRELPRVQP
jgi:tRNA (mo5U34)-methyltransferase